MDMVLVVGDSCCPFLARNLALYFRFLGFVLNLYPQHGHHNPSHFINISHIWQRFCPLTYRPEPTGFCALWRIHIPLQVIQLLSLVKLITYVKYVHNYYLNLCDYYLEKVNISHLYHIDNDDIETLPILPSK